MQIAIALYVRERDHVDAIPADTGESLLRTIDELSIAIIEEEARPIPVANGDDVVVAIAVDIADRDSPTEMLRIRE